MDWNLDSDYHVGQTSRNEQLLEFFFNREVKYLPMFQRYDWCPKLLDIDIERKKIYIEFTHETVNHILYDGHRSLDDILPDWKQQLHNILVDFKKCGYYKTALYPHCFYIKNNILKVFDYYGCVEMNNPYVNISDIQGMIGGESIERFNMATENGVLNISVFFEYTLKHHLGKSWIDNIFPELYNNIYE
jgi:hypothetical protein